jgi:SEC-C motif-containing protein
MTPKNLSCPCGGGLFSECCARFIVQAILPHSAAELMRSRYTAYALRVESYLQSTWHHSTRPPAPIVDNGVKWISLTLCQQHQSGNSANVEFVAHYKINGRAHKLHEISRFVCEGNRWFYLDGNFPEGQ